MSGDRKPAVFLGGEGGTLPGEGTFSRDGKWLAFTEYSRGKREVYITSFPARQESGRFQWEAVVPHGGGGMAASCFFSEVTAPQ